MVLNYREIMQRLKNKLHVSEDKDIANLFGISSAALSTRKKNNSIPFEHIIDVCSEHGFSIDYIIKGGIESFDGIHIGEDEKENVDKKNLFTLPYIQNVDSVIKSSNIDLKNVKNHIVLPKESYPELQSPLNNLCAVTAHGNSMEGNINNGAIMLINFADHIISSGCVYVINLQNEILVRRIFLDPNNNKNIIIRADNTYYPEFSVSNVEVKILGKIIAAFNTVKLV